MHYICALIEFTPRGHNEEYWPSGSTTSSSLEGYETPETWKPCDGVVYHDGTPVLDKRPVLQDSISVLLRAPVLRLVDPFKDDEVINRLLQRLSTGNWNLHKCNLKEHIEYWTANGARLGHIIQGKIVWDEAQSLAS